MAGRPRTAACTVVAEARVLARSPLAWCLVLVSVPVPLTIVRGGDDLRGAGLAVALVGAATMGVAIDEVGGAVADAAAVWAGWRRALRIPMVLLAVTGAWVLAAECAAVAGVGMGAVEELAWPTTAVACAAVALALVLPGDDTGVVAGIITLLGAATSTVLATRWAFLPSVVVGGPRWAWIAAGSTVLVVRSWRDPTSATRATRTARADPGPVGAGRGL